MLATDTTTLASSSPAPVTAPAPLQRRPSLSHEDLATYLPLVWRVARKVARRLPHNVDAAELVGAGTIGLMGALARKDEDRLDSFLAYAEIRIRGAILDQLREMDWMPRGLRRSHRHIEATKAQLENDLGRTADSSELAEALGLSVEAVDKTKCRIESAQVQRGVELQEAVAGQDPDMLALLEHKEVRVRLGKAVNELCPKYQEILNLHYIKELKLREIGEIYGVTESRVCQIHKKIVAELRATLLDD
jgi:RNA polymerase sigma factor FliA